MNNRNLWLNFKYDKVFNLFLFLVGTGLILDTSTEIVMNCINNESHLPIPVRLADLETHKMRKKLIGE